MRLLIVDETLRLFVAGTPVPQGSKTAFVVGKRAVVTDANAKALKPWRALVKAAAVEALHGRAPIADGPIVIAAEFRFVRPKSSKRPFPSVKPDADKLLRAVLDSLTDAGVWPDDSRVVKAVTSKVYADRAGVEIRIGVIS